MPEKFAENESDFRICETSVVHISMVLSMQRVHYILFAETPSRPIAKWLENLSAIPVKAVLDSEPSLWDEFVW